MQNQGKKVQQSSASFHHDYFDAFSEISNINFPEGLGGASPLPVPRCPISQPCSNHDELLALFSHPS